jgi:prepilin-type N-terminal cleavage/methylation domain-containing protein
MTSALGTCGDILVRTNKQTGFTLIEVLFVCALIGIISAMALPRLLMAKQAADASSAIGSMRTINSSQLGYAASCGGGYYSPDLTTLGVPSGASNVPFISPDLSLANTVVKSGYTIDMMGTPDPSAPATCNGLPAGAASKAFKAGADPGTPTNYRYFATNAGATIYEDTASLYAGMPEMGIPLTGHTLE